MKDIQQQLTEWNNLPVEVVNAKTLNSFKNKIDRNNEEFLSRKYFLRPIVSRKMACHQNTKLK